jgi:hypothetical protein
LAKLFGKRFRGGGGGRPDFAQGKATMPAEGGLEGLATAIADFASGLGSPA